MARGKLEYKTIIIIIVDIPRVNLYVYSSEIPSTPDATIAVSSGAYSGVWVRSTSLTNAGRIYTIAVEAIDSAGNTARCSDTVVIKPGGGVATPTGFYFLQATALNQTQQTPQSLNPELIVTSSSTTTTTTSSSTTTTTTGGAGSSTTGTLGTTGTTGTTGTPYIQQSFNLVCPLCVYLTFKVCLHSK